VLDLTPDEVLTTTRAVRRRPDVSRPVARELVEKCLEVALQAPNGSNLNTWRWLAVDDRGTIEAMAVIYDAALDDNVKSLANAVGKGYTGASVPGIEKISASVQHLREHLHEVPVLVVPLFAGRSEGARSFFSYGSSARLNSSILSPELARWTTSFQSPSRSAAERRPGPSQ
jgi:nitroreductase